MVPVRAGQAGGEVWCKGCGDHLAVPKFGELSKFPLVEKTEVDGRSMWNSSKGLTLLGFVGFFAFMAAGVWLRLPTQSPVQAAALQASDGTNKCSDLRCVEKPFFKCNSRASPMGR